MPVVMFKMLQYLRILYSYLDDVILFGIIIRIIVSIMDTNNDYQYSFSEIKKWQERKDISSSMRSSERVNS